MTTTPEIPRTEGTPGSAPETNGQTAVQTVQDVVGDALRAPAGDPIPHPALDVEPATQRAGEGGLDKVVFGVSAAVAVAFLLWGLVSTESLSSRSGDALGWVMGNAGWLFVLTSSCFVVFVIWLAASRY